MNAGGLFAVVGGGILSGLFTSPLRFIMPQWSWENCWLMYSIFGMVVFPWMMVLSTVHNLRATYAAVTDPIVFVEVITFGMLWGIGSVCFGLGTAMVGNSLGFALILSMTSVIGSIIPMIVFHQEKLVTSQGTMNFVGLAITIIGLIALGYAGKRREKEQGNLSITAAGGGGGSSSGRFTLGIIICIISGITSPCLNLSLAFGDPISKSAIDHGTPPAFAGNAVWCIGVGAGFLVNFAYSAWLLSKNETWSKFRGGDPSYVELSTSDDDDIAAMQKEHKRRSLSLPADGAAIWIFSGPLMGLMWFGGTSIYGIGAQLLGSIGTSVGWSVYMICMVLTANASGIVAGEWKNTSKITKLWCGAALLILFSAIAVIAVGGSA